MASSVTVRFATVPAVRTGASLTAVTKTLVPFVAVLNAVAPPLVETFAVPPEVPVVWSQALYITKPEPPAKSPLGTNRSPVVASDGSKSAAVVVGLPTLIQSVPLSVYSQWPFELSTDVMAIPFRAPVSTSVCSVSTRVETSVPLLAVSSSRMPLSRLTLPSNGASLTGVTLIVRDGVPLEPPSPSVTSNVTVREMADGLSDVFQYNT